ncbi:MAG: DUF4360 domain-containing protein [Pseudobdellovibrionaceae bacterium]
MKMNLFAVPLFTLSITFGLQSFAQTPPNASISDVQLAGNGCNGSSAAVTISPDLMDLSVLFDNYSAEIGNGTKKPNSRQDRAICNLKLKMSIPPGWQYAFKSVDYRGFVNLPSQTVATHRLTFLTSGQPIPSLRDANHEGPKVENYTMSFNMKPSRYVWSPCGVTQHPININSDLSIQYHLKKTNHEQAQILVDSADFSARQSIGLIWRRCG